VAQSSEFRQMEAVLSRIFSDPLGYWHYFTSPNACHTSL